LKKGRESKAGRKADRGSPVRRRIDEELGLGLGSRGRLKSVCKVTCD